MNMKPLSAKFAGENEELTKKTIVAGRPFEREFSMINDGPNPWPLNV